MSETEVLIFGIESDTGTTAGFVDDYDADCGGGTSTSPDAVYFFELDAGVIDHFDIEICNADYDTKMMIYNGLTESLIACSEDYCGVDGYRSQILNLDLSIYAGLWVYIVIDGWGGEFGNYILNITEANPCSWTVPGGATVEGEICGIRENDGCNMGAPAFIDVVDGEVVAAKVWADTNSRDTDWYRLTVGAPDTAVMILSAPDHNQIAYGILESTSPGSGNCGDLTGFINPFKVFASACSEDTVKVYLPNAGTYFFFAARAGYWGNPCADPLFGFYSRELDYWVKFDVCNTTWYADADGDGYGDPSTFVDQCSPPSGYVDNGDDCDDTDAGLFDEDTYYEDDDGDGYGDPATPTLLCSDGSAPSGYSTDNTDCDDADAGYHSPVTYYEDQDSDGYGDPGSTISACGPAPPGYVNNPDDCLPLNPAFPVDWYIDSDGDGYGVDPLLVPGICASPPPGFSSNNLDCDDGDAGITTGPDWYEDQDGDGFGDPGSSTSACSPPSGYVADNTDNCPDVANPGQEDQDSDGTGDACCCVATRGDLNDDGGEANILDLNFAVNRVFRAGPLPNCPVEGDVDSNGASTNILDLNFLVNKVFRAGPAPGPCP